LFTSILVWAMDFIKGKASSIARLSAELPHYKPQESSDHRGLTAECITRGVEPIAFAFMNCLIFSLNY